MRQGKRQILMRSLVAAFLLLPSDLQIIGADFGVIDRSDPDHPVFVATNTVPLIENQNYGWVIYVHTAKPVVHWREELTLPQAPQAWGGPDPPGSHVISQDKRTSVLERDTVPDQGAIDNIWSVARGDPPGHYVIRVLVEGRFERVFEFDVR